MKILAGSSHIQLATDLSHSLNAPMVNAEIRTFPNGEKYVRILDQVVGEDVVLVQSFNQPVDEHLIEFILLADALERGGAREVHAVIPWLGYSLQDKLFLSGEALSAKVCADLISNSYIKRVILLDLHNHSIPGFFSIPTQVLSSLELLAQQIEKTMDHSKLVVASPDFGGLKRAREFAKRLNAPLINIDKQRDLITGQVQATALHGDAHGKTVVVFDDCIVGGGTVAETAKVLKENGAESVTFVATHGLFVGDGQTIVQDSPVDSVLVTNSIKHDQLAAKITQISVADLFASSIKQWLK